jgi:hypothetical protein
MLDKKWIGRAAGISDYEHMLISAVRYALGRRTYIVKLTTDYIARQIPKLSDECITLMIEDIKNPLGGYGDPWDKQDWLCLLEQLEEEMGKRYGQS